MLQSWATVEDVGETRLAVEEKLCTILQGRDSLSETHDTNLLSVIIRRTALDPRC